MEHYVKYVVIQERMQTMIMNCEHGEVCYVRIATLV